MLVYLVEFELVDFFNIGSKVVTKINVTLLNNGLETPPN